MLYMTIKKKISIKEKESILNPKNWEISKTTDRLYTSDHVIDAYIEGKTVGADEERKILMKSMNDNIDAAGKYAQDVLNELKNVFGFNTLSAHLKIDGVSDFKILVFLHSKDFLTDRMLDVYSRIFDMEQNAETDYFRIHTSFGNTKNTINDDVLISDGYCLHFRM